MQSASYIMVFFVSQESPNVTILYISAVFKNLSFVSDFSIIRKIFRRIVFKITFLYQKFNDFLKERIFY